MNPRESSLTTQSITSNNTGRRFTVTVLKRCGNRSISSSVAPSKESAEPRPFQSAARTCSNPLRHISRKSQFQVHAPHHVLQGGSPQAREHSPARSPAFSDSAAAARTDLRVQKRRVLPLESSLPSANRSNPRTPESLPPPSASSKDARPTLYGSIRVSLLKMNSRTSRF